MALFITVCLEKLTWLCRLKSVMLKIPFHAALLLFDKCYSTCYALPRRPCRWLGWADRMVALQRGTSCRRPTPSADTPPCSSPIGWLFSDVVRCHCSLFCTWAYLELRLCLSIPSMISNRHTSLQGDASGCRTGNGGKINNSQAACLAWLCLGAV